MLKMKNSIATLVLIKLFHIQNTISKMSKILYKTRKASHVMLFFETNEFNREVQILILAFNFGLSL